VEKPNHRHRRLLRGVRHWRAANREKIREQARRYYWANPNKHREQRRERRRIRKAQMRRLRAHHSPVQLFSTTRAPWRSVILSLGLLWIAAQYTATAMA
jgi:hypothetical protein